MGAGALPGGAAGRSLTTVGIVAALPQEARCVAARRVARGTVVAVAGPRLLHVCGPGAERAATAAAALAAAGAGALLCIGVAGALKPGLRCGTLLLPASVGDLCGRRVVVDAAWRSRWLGVAAGLALETGPLLELPSVAGVAEDKRELGRGHGAVAADMESAAVLRVAAELGLPGMVVRAVLDEAEQDIPAAAVAALADDGSVAALPLLRALARRPRDLPGLVALALAQRRALAALRELLARGLSLSPFAALDENAAGAGHNRAPCHHEPGPAERVDGSDRR